MLTYGTQVNPALLRQDFSSILQGAQAQAQATQQAAQMRAQAMASAASTISEGFKTYVQNREKNSILEGKNSGMLRSIGNDPALNADPEFLKLKQKQEKSGGLSLGDNAKMNALLTTYSEQNRMRQEEQRQKDYLKLQQDAAAINAERAAREKAEYTRRNQFQENIIRIAKENPDVLKDPKMAVQAVLSAGGNYEDAQRIQGGAITQQQFDLELTQRNMDLAKRSLELAEAARRGEVTGKEPDVRVFEQNGVKMVVLLDALKQPIGQPHVVAQAKPSVGEKTQRNALEYHIAEQRGDTAGMQRAMIDIIADNPEATRNLSPQEIRQNLILPFVPRVGGEVAPTEPLRVTGAPKPVSAPPAPSPEAARITQSPSATPPSLGRTFAPMAGAAPFEAPSPMAAVAPAPQPAVAPAPASTAPSFPSGPVPVIQIPDEDELSSYVAQMTKRRTTVDKEAGSMLLPERTTRAQNINQYGTAYGSDKESLSTDTLKLLEPKRIDSSDTRAIKQIIPYLTNRSLAQRLLKDLSDKKEPKLSSLDKDPFARSMFNAAKEGRLPQLNTAAGRGF